ncbi:MAG TPA: hypothetical protein VF665_09395 [Longimicrobium sp.]|jgi:hypothetical protein|uniref:hypothetical protein n=1 Tax=Longimicrobium sp. TaxID=2029185 RepID=UPI002ED9BA76
MAEMNHQQLADALSEGARLDADLADVANAVTDASAMDAAGADVREKVCALWKKIRTAVVWVSNFPLIPGNIRAVLKQLIALLDGLCGA